MVKHIRVSCKSLTFLDNNVQDMLTTLSLYQLIHPDDVELLWMFVKGNFWTYGTVLDDAHTITERVAPPLPPPQTLVQPDHTQPVSADINTATFSSPCSLPNVTYMPDIHLKLAGLDPVSRTGVFMSVYQ